MAGDGLGGALVVQKHIARNAGQTDALRLGGGHGFCAGAAVDEKQMAPLQFGHQPGHGDRLGGHAAAHVVIDTGGIRHFQQRGIQTAFQFRQGQFGVPGVRTGRGVHWHVQNHRFTGAVSLAGKLGGVWRVRHDRQRDRAWERQGTAVAHRVLTQIVDDQGEVGFRRFFSVIDRRCMRSASDRECQQKRAENAHPSVTAGDTQPLQQAKRLAELEVVILRTRLGRCTAFDGRFVGAAIAVAQVTHQVGFLVVLAICFAGDLGPTYHDVRVDTLRLNRATVRRVIQRRGDLQCAIVVQRQNGLHRAFAEGIGTHQDAAFLVLQGTGDDFRRRGAAAVDQHHQWHAFAGVCRVGRKA
ncbi:hypothetical protein ALQ08_05072 [Pseudomonas syringae pv. delphinii]|uniref:Uncharacterized protein n=1 Tax=Pseudomonas syringae pv. delphinii TaxID=192088 RepID=A0A3M4JY62_9PSED|nr:hypothetical protein ALQ08_05072 [Pseudomonas syringae pv. delphinii]